MYERHFSEGAFFGPKTERARDIIFAADKAILKEILRVGGMETYTHQHPELAEAFTDKEACLCCMDERAGKGTLHVPGSGIGIEGEEAQAAFRNSLKEAGIKGVYSHDKCGAAKLYAEKHGIEDYDVAAISYTQDLARKLGVEYKGHVKTSGEHPGRVVYFDTTGELKNGSAVWQEKMPTGFVISRTVLNEQEARDALVLAVKIAFSDHGYGPKFFSEEDPLSLVYIAKPSLDIPQEGFSKEQLQEELRSCYQQILREIPEAAGKIHLDGFTAPDRSLENKELAA